LSRIAGAKQRTHHPALHIRQYVHGQQVRLSPMRGAEVLVVNMKGGCKCLVCNLEKNLTLELNSERQLRAYQDVAAASPLLFRFPTASDLLEQLRRSGAVDDHRGADEILGELLRLGESVHRDFIRCLLLVALVPTLHRTSRLVSSRFSALAPDDVEQYIVTSALEILQSEALRKRQSYFAFAIAQSLRRNVFRWAIREARASSFEEMDIGNEPPVWASSKGGLGSSLELHALLQRSVRDRLLTESEHQLLVSFKIREIPVGQLAVREGQSEGAFRHRMLRLIAKLRQAAQTTPSKSARSFHDRNLQRKRVA
jgi:hypothetical protein